MSRFASVVLICLTILELGCSGKKRPEGLPELFPTEIKVTQEGTAVAGAFVRLIPSNINSPWSCGGSTNENGIATIRVNGEFDGAPEGEYSVVVSKTKSDAPSSSQNDLSNLDAKPPAKSSTYDLIDPQYASPVKTPLKVTVSREKKLTELDVGPAVRLKQNTP